MSTIVDFSRVATRARVPGETDDFLLSLHYRNAPGEAIGTRTGHRLGRVSGSSGRKGICRVDTPFQPWGTPSWSNHQAYAFEGTAFMTTPSPRGFFGESKELRSEKFSPSKGKMVFHLEVKNPASRFSRRIGNTQI